jgi:hypothetical protein
VEGILAFAERVLPSASNLWVRRRSLRSSACSRCSFRTGFASTGRSLLDRYKTLQVFNYLGSVSGEKRVGGQV